MYWLINFMRALTYLDSVSSFHVWESYVRFCLCWANFINKFQWRLSNWNNVCNIGNEFRMWNGNQYYIVSILLSFSNISHVFDLKGSIKLSIYHMSSYCDLYFCYIFIAPCRKLLLLQKIVSLKYYLVLLPSTSRL